MTSLDTDALRAIYDVELRALVPQPLPEGVVVEHDPPVTRFLGFGGQGWVEYRDLGDLDEAELDAVIARQIERLGDRCERFEWKLHGHDRPPFLAERLLAAGFRPEERETVVIAAIDDLELGVPPPDGVAIREVHERRDLERIAALELAVWGDGSATQADDLERERAADPEALRIFVAEAAGTVVSAGWIRLAEGTEFGTLWGGSTLPAWRRRGIYRALVVRRAQVARDRGRRYLEVDASDDSRPILERMGFRAVTTTTPYIWRR
jgi:GNAT superfamily N-acetyltransferase